MDTQDTGTTEVVEQTASTETEETTTSETSEAGIHEDADYKRAVDKKAYLADLDRQIKEKEGIRNKGKKREVVTEDQDDIITWTALNADSLKMVGKEYQEELSFYKTHGITVTTDIRERALRDAKARKGLSDTKQQQQISSEGSAGETRKTETRDVPDSIKALRPDMTYEQYKAYKTELDNKKKG